MNILAKVKCNKVDKGGTPDWPYEIVDFNAVYSSDPETENYSFSKATPSLNLTMSITNPGAFGAFEAGKEYYLDFTPVE